MIDFMANIKNKKNMTKCNIKTFVATSVLCVFFNGAAIYGMNDESEDTVGGKGNKKKEKVIEVNFNGTEEEKNENEIPVKKYKIIVSDKKKQKTEGIRIHNYKGNISLCCCVNYFNNFDKLKADYEKQNAQKEHEDTNSQNSEHSNNFDENEKLPPHNNNVVTLNMGPGSAPVPGNK